MKDDENEKELNEETGSTEEQNSECPAEPEQDASEKNGNAKGEYVFTEKKKNASGSGQGIKVLGIIVLLVILIGAAAAAISAYDKRNAENNLTEASFFSIASEDVIDLAPYPGGAVVLTSSDIEYIDRYGELIASNDHTFSSPVMKVSGKDLIVYDRGGYGLKIERSSSKYRLLEFQSAVSCADICSNGAYAYVLNADGGYQSHLYVYSARGELKYEWGSSDYLLCLSLSQNGRYAAVGMISVDNADYVSRVLMFDYVKEEPVYDVEFTGKTVYDIEFASSKKLAVLTDSGFYMLDADGARTTLDEYSVTELCHSDIFREGLAATAVNLYGSYGNVLARIYPKGLKNYYEHSFSKELTALYAGETNTAFVFGSEIEIYDRRDSLTGKIILQQPCLRCALTDNRIFVCVSGGIYSFNVNESYEVTA